MRRLWKLERKLSPSLSRKCHRQVAGDSGRESWARRQHLCLIAQVDRCGPGSISLSEGLPGWICPASSYRCSHSFISFQSSWPLYCCTYLHPRPHSPTPCTLAEFLSDVALWASPSGFCELQRCSSATPKHQSALSLPRGRGRMVPSVLRIMLLQGVYIVGVWLGRWKPSQAF